MPNKPGIKAITVPETTWRALRQASTDGKGSMQEIAAEAIDEWLSRRKGTSDVQATRSSLHSELDRLARAELDPERVPGSLLIEFNANGWPVGKNGVWSWRDDALWAEEDEPQDDCEPLDAARFYDIRGYVLDPQDGGDVKDLESFVRDFLAKADR